MSTDYKYHLLNAIQSRHFGFLNVFGHSGVTDSRTEGSAEVETTSDPAGDGPSRRHGTERTGQESMGDVARKANPGQKPDNSKHVFTDDDVAHIQESGKDPVPPGSVDLRGKINAAQTVLDRWKDKKPREVSDAIAGETQFPGRDNWEQRLYQRKEAMVSAARATLDALNRQLDAATEEQRINAGKAANSLYSDFTLEKHRYDQLVAEGVRKAADWERQRR